MVWEEAAVSLGTCTSCGKGAARRRHSNCRDDGSHGESHTPDRCWDTWGGRIFLITKSDYKQIMLSGKVNFKKKNEEWDLQGTITSHKH